MCLPIRIDDHVLRSDMYVFRNTATVLVVLLMVAACSPIDSTSPGASGSPVGVDASRAQEAPTPTPDPVDIAVQGAVDTYLAMWSSYARAATTADWQAPELGRFATGAALSTMTRGLFSDHEKGLVARGEPTLNPRASSVEPVDVPVRVVLSDCGDSTNWTRHQASSGEFVDESSGRRSINAIVEKQSDGSWKVTDFGVREVGSC